MINTDRLKEAIYEKYGTLTEFAQKLDYNNSQLTRALSKQSPKFLAKCKKAGIDIDELLRDDEDLKNSSVLIENKTLRKRNKELEKIVEHQSKLLDAYKRLLDKDGTE